MAMSRLVGTIDGVIGVDTHRDTLAAAAIDRVGGLLAQASAGASSPWRPGGAAGACRGDWWSWGAPAQEQHVGVVGGQQVLDAVFSPDPVLPGTKAGWLVLGGGHQFGEPVVVGVDGLVPRAASSLITVDFPVPDIPVSSTRFIDTTWRLAESAARQWRSCGSPRGKACRTSVVTRVFSSTAATA